MPQNIYLFETRNADYLKPYIDKASLLGFNVIHTDYNSLKDDKLYKQFMEVYKHYSVNSPEFEIICFARYFAMAALLKNEDSFFLTDSDVYITKAFRDMLGYNFKGSFVGSEGFDTNGSQLQISPHCTVWNRELLMDFITFTIDAYKQNQQNNFLEDLYISQTAKYTRTAISDMNLLYLWIKANNVPYLNSNSTKFPFGIDHNISQLICEEDEFKAFENRKYLKIEKDRITCFLKSGKTQDMALLHFQGIYKDKLNAFYKGKYSKFRRYTLRHNNAGKLKTILKMFNG